MTNEMEDLDAALQRAREGEKEQALFYRALAVAAIARDEAELTQRFQELHADEQHHLSRLTARLLELGAAPAGLDDVRPAPVGMDAWEPAARAREEAEVSRYRGLLERELDGETRALLAGILETEEHHASELGGKWTAA